MDITDFTGFSISSAEFDLDDHLVPQFEIDNLELYDRSLGLSPRVTVEPVENLIATQGDLQELLINRLMNELPLDSCKNDVANLLSRSDDGYETSSSHADSSGVSSDHVSETESVTSCVEGEHLHHQCSEQNIDLEILSKMAVDELSSSSDPDAREARDAVAILERITTETSSVGILDQYDVNSNKIEMGLFPELMHSPSDSPYVTKTSKLDSDSFQSAQCLEEVRCTLTPVSIGTTEEDSPSITFDWDQTCGPIPEFSYLLDQKLTSVLSAIGQNTSVSDLNKTGQMLPTCHIRQISDYDDDDDDDKSIMLEDLLDEDYIPIDQRRRAVINGRVSKAPNRHKQTGPETSAFRRSRRQTPQLWKFLLNSLCNPKLNPSVIEWKDVQKGVFKLTNAKKISYMWGSRVHKDLKKPMTYDKFSRAIRYYYDKRVVLSYPGRLTYQFGPNATGWRAAAQGATCGMDWN